MRSLVLTLISTFAATSAALAHGGHIGDLAGHSHWVGWAAAAAAAAVAAWAIKRGTKAKDAEENDGDEAAADADGETAEA